jgi:hypothetical protein
MNQKSSLREVPHFVSGALTANIRQLVDIAKLRWRIERDYHELKQEVGLGHFEGRSWRGFHHHATLCIAAYGFLVSERETIPPSEAASTTLFKEAAIPETYRPRGSAIAAGTTRSKFDCHHSKKIERHSRVHTISMPLLHQANLKSKSHRKIMTQ